MRRPNCPALVLIALTSLWMASGASAAVQPDPTFGEGGVVHLPPTAVDEVGTIAEEVTSQKAVAIEPDGALILATNHSLERLDPAGRPDPTFGEAGAVVPPPPSGGTIDITGAALAAEGKLVVVATSYPAGPEHQMFGIRSRFEGRELEEPERTEARIYRYLPDGALDPTFGEGGIVETTFGLPARKYRGVRLSAQPVVETTGVAVDGEGRVIVTGGVPAAVTGGGCNHDDFTPSVTYSAFVAVLTSSGKIDAGFGRRGVFGGQSARRNPLRMEDAASPVSTPTGDVLYQRGAGHCRNSAGAWGYVLLTPDGKVAMASKRGSSRLVLDATVAPDGSIFLLLRSADAYLGAPDSVEKLLTDGSPDPSFGTGGFATLKLPGVFSYLTDLRVAPDGEVLLSGIKMPTGKGHYFRFPVYSRAAVTLVGLTPSGARDPRVGPRGIASKHLTGCHEDSSLWVDGEGRAMVTAHCEAKGDDHGFAAIRFVLPG